MKDIAITRRDDVSENIQASNVTIHLHPFRTLPGLNSHLHPKFVLLEAGRKLGNLSNLVKSLRSTSQAAARGVETLLVDLRTQWPIIESIEHIYEAWVRPRNLPQMLANPSFNPPPIHDTRFPSFIRFDGPRTPTRRSKTRHYARN